MNAFVPMLAHEVGAKDLELVEKDVRLHSLLASLTRHPVFSPHLAFKGGTCLIKCYLDYPRFSTDLDFTWVDEPMGSTAIDGTHALRRRLRPNQRDLERWFRTWAEAEGYRLNHPEFFHYGRTNRMMTVNLQYPSQSETTGLIKVQLNFDESLAFPTVGAQANSLLRGAIPAKFRLLEGDPAVSYATPLPVLAYDPREILIEKCRAILTRTAPKWRDLVDLYLLEKDLKLRVEDFRPEIVNKARRAVRAVTRYREQAQTYNARQAALLEEDVRPLLLKPIDHAAFQVYRERVVGFLGGLLPEVLDA